MKFLISTSPTYSPKTLPILVPSLIRSGVSTKDIVICYNDNEEKAVTDYLGITHKHYNTDMFEYVSFLAGVETDDDCFLLHDTCEVDIDFVTKLNMFILNKEYDCIRLKLGYSNNMGVYSKSYLKSIEDRILGIPRNMNKKHAIDLEDKFWGGRVLVFGKDPLLSKEDVYNTGSPRRVEHYMEIGVKKYKGTYSQQNIKTTL